MQQNLLQARTLFRAVRQAPANERLAFCNTLKERAFGKCSSCYRICEGWGKKIKNLWSCTAVILLEIQVVQELTFGDTLCETGRSLDDVSVSLKGNVSTHHIKQQDAQRPDGERKCFVTLMKDPLGWTVNSGSFKQISE